MIGRLGEIVIDCRDPAALARFWQGVLGGDIVRESSDWVAVEPARPGHSGLTVSFQQVPEPKLGKNRVHLDVDVDDVQTAAAQAEALGARRISQTVIDATGTFVGMADPEGNEFCFVTGPTAELADEQVA